MSYASMLSGRAINITKTTSPHAISYPFTSIFGIPHGHAASLTLDKFLVFNYLNLDRSQVKFDLNKRRDAQIRDSHKRFDSHTNKDFYTLVVNFIFPRSSLLHIMKYDDRNRVDDNESKLHT